MTQLETLVQYDKSIPYIEDRAPNEKPTSYLLKDGEKEYKVVEGRRPSKMLLVNKLRQEVDKWREENYPGVTDTTRELLTYWFETDHLVEDKLFRFWFCQREAIETLIYLFEVKKFYDLKPVIETYSEKYRKDLLGEAVEIVEDIEGKRKVIRYFPESQQMGEQDLPEKGLLRYAFKMATGSGKTYVMALIIVWSYFNRIKENDTMYADNFLVIAPNVIVYERLAKDFSDNRIFHELPLIPPAWRFLWNLKASLRDDDSPFNPSGNLIVNNIQQLYESKTKEWHPETIVDAILGRKPQKDLTKSPLTLLDKIKELDNLIVMNDEAHHVHDEKLKWHETIMSIHNALPDNLTIWLDFSATPKTQTGTYYPWIVVDYPLAQAVEDRIVKTPLIVHRIDKKDPDGINSDNVVQKYGDWITASLERWKEHYEIYQTVGKKPVLFIMAEKNAYADRITEAIKKQKTRYSLSDDEVLAIHTDTAGDIRKNDLDKLRKYVRDIDKAESKIKIIVSVLMLREGWDVQNVTVTLGLRPFTSKANILPEQAVGRGLRLMRDVSPDHTQTLEVMGTQEFEKIVKKLEKEGVGINTVKNPPPLPLTIVPEKSRLKYDIEIPRTELKYFRNYQKLSEFNPFKAPSLYSSDKLNEERKIQLKMEFPITGTDVHEAEIDREILPQGRDLLSHITQEVIKRARFISNFGELYPLIEKYILQRCFEVEIDDVENKKLRKHLTDITIQESIIDLLAKELGKITVEQKEITIEPSFLKLSGVEKFLWRRKHLRCIKTVFNFVAVYNEFEAEFAEFLDKCHDIERFASLAKIFRIDYLSSRGAIRFYYPDFVAVQIKENEKVCWIIETKGREYEDTDKKEAAMKKWCEDVSKLTQVRWKHIKISQIWFNQVKSSIKTFSDLLDKFSEK